MNLLACPLGKVPSEARRKGAVRYVNYCLWRSAVLLASPRGEVASRSDDGEGSVSVAIKYRSSQQQFFRARRAQRKFRVEPVRNVRRRFCSQVTFSFRLPCFSDTHLLKFLFAARYINYLLWCSAVLLSIFYMLPERELAKSH